MTLATILFLLGILIIISKCDPFLGSKVPQRGPHWGPWAPIVSLLAFVQTLMSCLVVSVCLLTGKKVKCRKADSRSERSGSSGERGERGGSSLGCRGTSITEGPQGPPTSFPESLWLLDFLTLFSLVFASTAQHANPVSRSFPPQVRVRRGVVLGGGEMGAGRGRGAALDVPEKENDATSEWPGELR